jgi:hypothetical protein
MSQYSMSRLRSAVGVLRLLRPLAALALLAPACDAFDDPPEDSEQTLDGSAPGGGVVSPPGPILDEPPIMCTSCGDTAVCADCGRGCECSGLGIEPTSWRPPLSDVGDEGWMSSKRPLCAGLLEISSNAVWADQHGVFVAVSGFGGDNDIPTGQPDDDGGVVSMTGTPSEFAPRTHVLHNEGHGWALRAELEGSTTVRLTAASPVKLILYGDGGQESRACRLGVLEGNALACVDMPFVSVPSAVAVSKSRAFALTDDATLLAYDGTFWTEHSPPLAASGKAVWADADELVVAGDFGNVHRLTAGGWTPDNIGTTAALTAIWGTSVEDLWVGTIEGKLFHLDGAGWREVAQLGGVTCATREPVMRISGAGGHVWAHTSSHLARWNGSELESFGNWTCSPLNASDPNTLGIDDLWVVDENNVFVAFSSPLSQSSCGDAFVVHYDGEEFHRF